MTTTVQAVLTRMLKDFGCGFEIPNGSVGSFAATSVASTNFFQDSDKSTNHYRSQQAVIWRPGAASAADYLRFAGDLTNSNGTLAHTGANYSDTTVGSETVEIWLYGIRPDVEGYDAINKALKEKLFSPSFLPLSIFDDGDMSAANTTSWTGSSGSTLSKVTTARRIVYGPRALRVQNDSTNDYAQSGTVAVRQGDLVYIWAIASVDAGGDAVLVLYDVTNSADIDSTPQHSEESPQLMWYSGQVPASCKEMAVRLTGEQATGDIYWNVLGGYRVRDRRIDLPSYFDRSFEVQGLAYGKAHNPNTNQNVADALSIEITEIPQSDYALHFAQQDAHPRVAQFFTDQWFKYPLFIQGRRPQADIDGTITAPSSSITADHELVVAAAEMAFLEVPANRKKLPNGDELYGTISRRLEKVNNNTKTDGPAQRKQPVYWPRVMN